MPNSPMSITSEDRKNYLYFYVKANVTSPTKVLDWLSEVALLSARTRNRRILIDRDIPNVVIDGQLASAFEAVTDASLHMRIAIVNRFPEVGRDMQKAL